jgi:sugar phosphate isomerase/epimerase
LLANRPFEAALDYLKDLGVEAVEIGCGGYLEIPTVRQRTLKRKKAECLPASH